MKNVFENPYPIDQFTNPKTDIYVTDEEFKTAQNFLQDKPNKTFITREECPELFKAKRHQGLDVSWDATGHFFVCKV